MGSGFAAQDTQRKEVLRPLKMSNKRGSKAGMGLAMNEAWGTIPRGLQLDLPQLLERFESRPLLGQLESPQETSAMSE